MIVVAIVLGGLVTAVFVTLYLEARKIVAMNRRRRRRELHERYTRAIGGDLTQRRP
jgi:hypothetical protein